MAPGKSYCSHWDLEKDSDVEVPRLLNQGVVWGVSIRFHRPVEELRSSVGQGDFLFDQERHFRY